MTSKLSWLVRQHLRKVWVRVVAFALLALATAVVAQFVSRFIPSAWTVARDSLARRLETPFMGGRPLTGDVPVGTFVLRPADAGYVRHIDVSALSTCGEELESEVWLTILPGSFVHEARPLLHLQRSPDEDMAERLRAAFTLGAERTFDQDPRFGVIVLSEIASRALSPAVNDPGTAISVLGRLVRVLGQWKENPEPEIEYPNVHVPPLKPEDLMEDAFCAIARDGADIAEVTLRLRKSVEALADIAPEIYRSVAVANRIDLGSYDSAREDKEPETGRT